MQIFGRKGCSIAPGAGTGHRYRVTPSCHKCCHSLSYCRILTHIFAPVAGMPAAVVRRSLLVLMQHSCVASCLETVCHILHLPLDAPSSARKLCLCVSIIHASNSCNHSCDGVTPGGVTTRSRHQVTLCLPALSASTAPTAQVQNTS